MYEVTAGYVLGGIGIGLLIVCCLLELVIWVDHRG